MQHDHILFLEPVFKERIWGGRELEKQFGYNIPEGNIGECWGISAHPNGESTVKNGTYKGKKLSELWENNRALFGHQKGEKFPLLVKVLDANADLSVQVHPDDEYANTYESGELGKTECWYILDCKEGAEIIFGHTATSKAEATSLIESGLWQDFLTRRKITPGDFFYVPSGTIHALCKGTLVLEVQQSSDTTYRLYDYDRTDDTGNRRDLHIDKSLDVMTIPHKAESTTSETTTNGNATITKFMQNDFFSVYKYDITDDFTLSSIDTYSLVSVISGAGQVDGTNISKGDHFIIPATCQAVTFSGSLQLIVARP